MVSNGQSEDVRPKRQVTAIVELAHTVRRRTRGTQHRQRKLVSDTPILHATTSLTHPSHVSTTDTSTETVQHTRRHTTKIHTRSLPRTHAHAYMRKRPNTHTCSHARTQTHTPRHTHADKSAE